MFLFYTPFLYYYKTRLKSFYKLLSWMLIYLAPIYLAVYYSIQNEMDNIYFLLLIIVVHNLYEVGYIQNDTETIKKRIIQH